VARRAERTQEATPREVILIKCQIFDRSLVFTEGLNDLRTKRTQAAALREVVFTEIEGYEAPNFGHGASAPLSPDYLPNFGHNTSTLTSKPDY
jgi:hypothetical protein